MDMNENNIQKMEKEMEVWKERAKAAEFTLATLHSIFVEAGNTSLPNSLFNDIRSMLEDYIQTGIQRGW